MATSPPISNASNNRLIGAAVMLATLTPLLLAAWMQPATQGMGTHQQLGLPECGFLLNTGMPCATCGMTTAFSYATHGDLLSAFITQPAGAVLCILTAVFVLLGGWAMFSGMSLQPIGRALGRPRFFMVMFGLILCSWGYTLWTAAGS